MGVWDRVGKWYSSGALVGSQCTTLVPLPRISSSRLLYSASAYSARPALELRYSFLLMLSALSSISLHAMPPLYCSDRAASPYTSTPSSLLPLHPLPPPRLPCSTTSSSTFPRIGQDSPLNSPLHSLIRNQQRRTPVQDLMAGAAESVEDGGVECAGERVLSVLG